MNKTGKEPFLYEHQRKAVGKMFNGCILNGGTGSGKSRTGLFYYFKENGGWITDDGAYTPMKEPRDLYIITTAMKRDTLEWEGELTYYLLSPKEDLNYYNNKVVIDSWNNIKKYQNVYGAFFLFDEDRITGKGAWVKAFWKIAKKNQWIVLSATPGDTWEQYFPIFKANGFYNTRKEFDMEHVVYSPYTKYPQIQRYTNTGRLIKLRNKILIDMDFDRHTTQHHEDIFVNYDKLKYKTTMKYRWNPYEQKPIEQASTLCYILRRIVNEDESRQTALLDLAADHERIIVFYNFDYELDILKSLTYINDGDVMDIAEWNGHAHEPIPNKKKWVYLVQYTAGCEGWNSIKTNTIVFYSQNYSYKVVAQASGRIDRLNTPYTDLYYYHLRSRSGIDLAITKALNSKKKFNERKFIGD